MGEKEVYPGTRKELDRAIRRLDTFEYLVLGAAVVIALVGGAVVAFILSAGTELGFYPTWVVLSLVLLAVPGFLVLGRDRWKKRRRSDDPS